MSQLRPRAILDRARAERLVNIEVFADGEEDELGEDHIRLGPPATNEEIQRLEGAVPLPGDVRELLAFCGGFELNGNEVSFTALNEWGYDFLLPNVVVLMDDGSGNSWAIEVQPSGWGPVWYQCHDPPVLMLQCATLADFIDGVIDLARPSRTRGPNILEDTWEQSMRVWKERKKGPRAEVLLNSTDLQLRRFAASVSPHARIADLRQGLSGSGFDWSPLNRGPTPVKRDGRSLLFAIEPPKSMLGRLLGR